MMELSAATGIFEYPIPKQAGSQFSSFCSYFALVCRETDFCDGEQAGSSRPSGHRNVIGNVKGYPLRVSAGSDRPARLRSLKSILNIFRRGVVSLHESQKLNGPFANSSLAIGLSEEAGIKETPPSFNCPLFFCLNSLI
jgi:hypothetical protein